MSESNKCCAICLKCPDYPNGGHNYCHNKDCPCHSTTPSWEADFAHQFGKPVRDGVTIKLDPSGDTMLLSEKEVKAFIHSLLSRQREEMRREVERLREPEGALESSVTYNKAIDDVLSLLSTPISNKKDV